VAAGKHHHCLQGVKSFLRDLHRLHPIMSILSIEFIQFQYIARRPPWNAPFT
jgi:hypothetical protein